MFEEVMDRWAAEAREEATRAEQAGDERAKSIAKMRESMYAGMLRTLIEKPREALARIVPLMRARAEDAKARGDFDLADRCEIQRACAARALALRDGEGDK